MSGRLIQKNIDGKYAKIVCGFSLVFFAITFVAILFVAGLNPQRANAQVVPVLDSVVAANTKIIAINTTAVVKKETIWDGIVTSFTEVIISNMTQSIVRWINSGFEGGGPAFVTDPANFLIDVGDQIAGNFIAGTELGFVCQPFELDIRLALNLGYNSTFTERNFCRLSDVIANTENFAKFTNGDFSVGGWDSWFEISQNSSNNPVGVYLEAKNEIAIRTASGKSIELKKLDWGEGFLSSKKCVQSNPDSGNCIRYEIDTPGSVINDQLGNALGTGYRKLELADEFNEIVGALIGQISQMVLSEGLSSFSSSGENDNYFEQQLLTVTCSPNRTTVNTGEPVTWTARVTGGVPGTNTYLWRGTGTVEGGTTPSVTVSYRNPGIKTASVTVTRTTGGGQVNIQDCNPDVVVE